MHVRNRVLSFAETLYRNKTGHLDHTQQIGKVKCERVKWLPMKGEETITRHVRNTTASSATSTATKTTTATTTTSNV